MAMIADGGGGSHPDNISYYEVNSEWLTVRSSALNGWTWDHQEAKDAMAAADAADACAYADDFTGKINTFKGEFDAVVAKIDGLLSGVFKTHDGVAKTLRQNKETWSDVAKQIDQVKKDLAQHVRLDKWESEGALAYKAALPTQEKALTELEGIANSQGDACDQTGLMNAYIYSQARNGLRFIQNKLSKTRNYPVMKGGNVGGTINGQWIFDYGYFWRSYSAKAYLENFAQWVERQQNVTTADWASSANDLGLQLTKIETMPNNLQSGGQWPEGRAQTTGEAANTGSVQYNGTYVSGMSYRDADGNSIGFDRFGRG